MRLRVLDTGLRPARWNVAMSAALLRSADEDRAPATLRFHSYPMSCVIGRNQDAAAELDLPGCEAAGVEIARRVTGGGAVAMGPGVLAFDLVLPGRGLDVTRRAGEALAGMLCGLGLAARLATPGSVEIGGLKLSGSAGRLGRRAALHQATLILDLARTAPLSLLRRRTEGGRPTPDPRHRVGDLATHAPRILAENWNPQLRHAEERSQSASRSTHDRLSFETPAARAPQDDAVVSFKSGSHDEDRGNFSALKALLASAFAKAFGLSARSDATSITELADADTLLAQELGRDAYVFDDIRDWEDAA